MLVRKKTSTKKVLIIGVVTVVIILAAYFIYTALAPEEYFDNNTNQQAGLPSSYMISDQALEGVNFIELKRKASLDYTNQSLFMSFNRENPTAPVNVSVEDPGYGKTLDIFWKSPEDENFDLFRVYRSEVSGSKGDKIGETAENHFRDTSVENGKAYFYSVVSVNKISGEFRESGFAAVSGVAHDFYPPLSPTSVKVSNGDNSNSASISWQNPSDKDFSFIRIYRSYVKGEVGELIANEVKAESFVDSNLVLGRTYYYILTAVDTTGNESPKTLPYAISGRANPFEVIRF